jgi:hypothetical protein
LGRVSHFMVVDKHDAFDRFYNDCEVGSGLRWSNLLTLSAAAIMIDAVGQSPG